MKKSLEELVLRRIVSVVIFTRHSIVASDPCNISSISDISHGVLENLCLETLF